MKCTFAHKVSNVVIGYIILSGKSIYFENLEIFIN